MSANDYQVIWVSSFASGGNHEHASKHGSLESAKRAKSRAAANPGYEYAYIQRYDPSSQRYKTIKAR